MEPISQHQNFFSQKKKTKSYITYKQNFLSDCIYYNAPFNRSLRTKSSYSSYSFVCRLQYVGGNSSSQHRSLQLLVRFVMFLSLLIPVLSTIYSNSIGTYWLFSSYNPVFNMSCECPSPLSPSQISLLCDPHKNSTASF